MPVDRSAVEHVARLAHVGLTPEEIEEFSAELSSVIDHISKLQELDTSDVPPTAHAVPIENVLRPDTVRPSWDPDAVLFNAPRREDHLFEVQAILD